MGTKNRIAPTHLAKKLKFIREYLELTTVELIEKLDCPQVPLYRASITQYEKGRRELPLIVLLQYSRLINLPVEYLIDDNLQISK